MIKLVIPSVVLAAMLVGEQIALSAQAQRQQSIGDVAAPTAGIAPTQERRLRAMNRAMVQTDSIKELKLRKKGGSRVAAMVWICTSSTDECLEGGNNLQANGCSCSSEGGGHRCECPEGDE